MSVEQRLEISWSGGSLKELPRDFWAEFVARAGAQILSAIESDDLSAYLLSESSLFVWKDRALLITCGQMKLLNSISVDPFKITRGPSVFRLEIKGWNESAKAFLGRKRPVAEIRRYLDCESFLAGFQIDDHAFSPYGYSLNAIRGSDYCTIHISPELCGGHLSLEASIEIPHHVFNRFKADLIAFASP